MRPRRHHPYHDYWSSHNHPNHPTHPQHPPHSYRHGHLRHEQYCLNPFIRPRGVSARAFWFLFGGGIACVVMDGMSSKSSSRAARASAVGNDTGATGGGGSESGSESGWWGSWGSDWAHRHCSNYRNSKLQRNDLCPLGTSIEQAVDEAQEKLESSRFSLEAWKARREELRRRRNSSAGRDSDSGQSSSSS